VEKSTKEFLQILEKERNNYGNENIKKGE
jgi:hypothetical protein